APGGAKGAASEFPRPSVRGCAVFLATGKRLVEVDRLDGSVRHEIALSSEVDAATSKVVVGLADLLVFTGRNDGEALHYGFGDSGFDSRGTFSMPNGVASVGRDWVGVVRRSSPSLLRLEGGVYETAAVPELASSSVHREYLESKAPPTA